MITIVTITFNNYEELIKTINSIPKVSYIENIVINGGSCQKTFEYLKSNSIKHISEKDKGISDAFNKGLREASGIAVGFINSGDVLISQDYLLYANKMFTENPSLDFIYSSIVFDSINTGKTIYNPSQQYGDMPFPHPSLFIRKDVFNTIGEFNLNYKVAMDFDIAYRLKKIKAQGYYYDHGPVVLMDGGGVSSVNGIIGLKERLKILTDLGMLNFTARRYLYTLLIKQTIKDRIVARRRV